MSSVAKIQLISLVVCLVVLAPSEAARAFFVFGDSLVDNGNNNYLATTARADSPPYGIDYPTHRPTGRFSNGLNIPDIISYVSHYRYVMAIETVLLTCVFDSSQVNTLEPSPHCRT